MIRMPTRISGRGEASGDENEIDSATPSVTTAQLVVVSSRVRQIVPPVDFAAIQMGDRTDFSGVQGASTFPGRIRFLMRDVSPFSGFRAAVHKQPDIFWSICRLMHAV